MLHSELILTHEELSILVKKHINLIIQNPSFKKTNKGIQEQIYNLKDLTERY